MIKDSELKDHENLEEPRPFIPNLSLHLQQLDVLSPLKTPRSNLDVFHMREYGFIIIKPTKAENLSINKLEIGSWSLRNTCLQTTSQPN